MDERTAMILGADGLPEMTISAPEQLMPREKKFH